jgi:hypothetical protein
MTTDAAAEAALHADAVSYAQQAHSDTLVILHGDRILAEHYWNGTVRSTQTRLYSATKVVVSALVGQLVQAGVFTALEQKSSDLCAAVDHVEQRVRHAADANPGTHA